MAYDKVVDSKKLNSDLGDIAATIIAKTEGTYPAKLLQFPQEFIDAINSIPTGGSGGGGGESNIEAVEFVPPALPTFKHQTGTFELWGWGIKDASVAWMSDYYTFHGNVYSNAIDDVDHEMTLTIVNGKANGIPEMTRGKCLALFKS